MSPGLTNPAISYLWDQDRASALANNVDISKMGFTKTTPLNDLEKFSSDYGANVLDELTTEGQIIPVMTTGKGNDKGYAVVEYSNKIPVTKLAYDWLMKEQSIAGADSNVKIALKNYANGIKKLRKGAIKRRNIEALKVFTLGLAGTGTLTPNGQQLFSATHPYLQGLTIPLTFRNILGGSFGTANGAFNATRLQNMLDIHNIELRLGNGDIVEEPDSYLLMTGRALKTTARSVLNTKGNKANPMAGTGSNANLLNTFDFDGNTVELFVNPWLGQYDNNNTQIGSNTQYYLLNIQQLQDAQALRVINLDNGEADIWEDKNTKTMYTSYYESYDMDHFGAESFAT